MANIITGVRIVIAAALLFCPVFSAEFYFLYIIAGISDMTDGAVARKTNSVSSFGAKFDTAADFVFAAVCMIKLLPVIKLPVWIYIWIAVIAVIKVINMILGFVINRDPYFPHTIMNKVTGALLFALPLTLTFIDIKFSAAAVCAVATFSAIQEGFYIYISKGKRHDN